MNTYFVTFKAEFMEHRKWFLSWIIGLNLYMLLMLITYPGERGMQEFLDILKDDEFEIILGTIGTEAPAFRIWIAMLSGMNVIVFLIFSLFAGSRMALKSIDDKTGEINHTLPFSRNSIFLVRWTVIFLYNILFLMLWLIPIVLYPQNVPFEIIANTFWVGLIYMTMGASIGMFIAVLVGSSEKSTQNSLFFILIFYILQIVTRIVDSLGFLADFNILEFYQLNSIILQNEVNFEPILKMISTLSISLILGISVFDRKDLVKDASFSMNNNSGDTESVEFENNKSSVLYYIMRLILIPIILLEIIRKKSYAVFQLPLKNNYPISKDFLKADERASKIVFWAIMLFWPAQLLAYPGDQDTMEIVSGFSSNPMMKLFTYNHDLVNQPWLWFLITQSLGTSWIILIPLMLSWINKLLHAEISNGTGEIIGSLPLSKSRVMFERIVAIIIELLWIISWMMLWLVISESAIDKTHHLGWEIIAIIALFPFYLFLLLFTVSIGFVKTEGHNYARGALLVILMLFIIGMIAGNLNYWFITGIFGLYDPVAIIVGQSVSELLGIIVLTILTIPIAIGLKKQSVKFEWISTAVN